MEKLEQKTGKSFSELTGATEGSAGTGDLSDPINMGFLHGQSERDRLLRDNAAEQEKEELLGRCEGILPIFRNTWKV